MPKIFYLSIFTLLFVSCKQEETPVNHGDEASEIIDLRNQIRQLELNNSLKDSVINESLSFYNEIQANLSEIGIRRDEIRMLSDNPDDATNDKDWILEQIRYINFLREQNAKKVNDLRFQIGENNLQITELETMIETLVNDIQVRDEQISLLQDELDELDNEYGALFDAYLVQATQIEELTSDMNTAFYAYGSEKELSNNGVIEKKNGFIGIGKKVTLKDNFDENYFTKIDASKDFEIDIEGKKIRFITSHPSTSYTIKTTGSKHVISILDPIEFWKVSNYLVITTN